MPKADLGERTAVWWGAWPHGLPFPNPRLRHMHYNTEFLAVPILVVRCTKLWEEAVGRPPPGQLPRCGTALCLEGSCSLQ